MKRKHLQGFVLKGLLIIIAAIGGILAAVHVTNARKRSLDTAANTYAENVMEGFATAIEDEELANRWLCRAQEDGCGSRASCFSPWLLQQGLPSKYPEGVTSCELRYDVANNHTEIVVVSETGAQFILKF